MRELQFQRLRAGLGYPDVRPLFGSTWSDNLSNYDPIEYTAESVKAEVTDWDHPDLEAIWRRARLLSRVGEKLLRDSRTGRPLNPGGPTGISGYGKLWNYGPNFSADGIVMHRDKVLLIERVDTGQLAFPGGYREILPATGEYEDPVAAALREVREETGLYLNGYTKVIGQSIPYVVVRNTDNAWIEDSAVLIDVSDSEKSELQPVAADDAKKGSAQWIPIEHVDVSKMSQRHAEHVAWLVGRAIF